MKIELFIKTESFSLKELAKKNYCAINRHNFLKMYKDYTDLNKVDSYKDNEYIITDIDDVFSSINELGKRIYEKYSNEIIDIWAHKFVNNKTSLLKLLYKWIEPNGFPYYIDESLGAKVSEKTLLKFGRDSILIYLFNLIHKFCESINNTKDEYTEDIEDLSKLLIDIKLNKLLIFIINWNIDTNALSQEAIEYGKTLLGLLNQFNNENYCEDIKNAMISINNTLIYIVTTEIYYRDELDAFMCQPIFNKNSMIVLDTFNSLVGAAYHKLIAKITNIDAEEIRCRNCKAWVPRKSREQKYCGKKECQKVRDKNKKSRKKTNHND